MKLLRGKHEMRAGPAAYAGKPELNYFFEGINGMSQAQIELRRLRRIGLSQDTSRMAADFLFL